MLKRVVQKPSPRFAELPSVELDVWMKEVFEASDTVWDRHYPRREKVVDGRRCIFFKQVERKGKAVLFNAYFYVSGLTPDQISLDDLAETISAEKIVGEDGTHRDIAERFAVLVIGEVIIMEAGRIPGSGVLAIHAMRDMINRHTDAHVPVFVLEDAPTQTFKQMAKRHGGVDSVTARLAHDFVAEEETFGHAMETIVAEQGFSKFKVVTTIESESDAGLDVDKVEAILDESEGQTGLSGVTVKFKDGRSLGDMDNYREKLSITVNTTRPGVPNVNEIEAAIVKYLKALIKPDDENYQLIDGSGQFT